MNAVSIDIKDRLVAAGVGTFANTASTTWGIFVGEEQEKLKRTITLFDTGGFQPDLTLNTTRAMEHPTYQIRVRANTYQEGHDKIEDCVKALERQGAFDGTVDSTENSVRYSDTWRTSGILFLKKMEGSYVWTVNMIALRQERTY